MTKEVSVAEVAKHNTKESCWIIVDDRDDGGKPKVYDVTKYLDDHPGGGEVLVEQAGGDATNMFEDIGHTEGARQEMAKFLVGEVKLSEADKEALRVKQELKEAAKLAGKGGGLSPLPLLAVAAALIAGYYYSQQ